MPNFNQRGPMDEGAMTGRKMGKCTNFGAGRSNQTTQEKENIVHPTDDNSQNQDQGQGRGLGRGKGRGMGNGQGNGMGQNGGGPGSGRNCGGNSRGMGRRFPSDNIEQ